jgi:beta-phosphoglucomutase-like phosphatase (HAD superfamily)
VPRAPEQPGSVAHSDRSSRGENGFVGLDELSVHWRIAFIAAQDALTAIGRCGSSLRFPVSELRELSGNLERERAVTAVLLDDVAREEHVTLRHRLSAPRATRRMLGLPDTVLACVFDLDGVLTASADLHAAAWREALDPLLAGRVELTGERFAPFIPFDQRTDYYRHLHARPRLEGVHTFLASRGIRLPEGHVDDPPETETVNGLANRKNEALLRRLEEQGVMAFGGSLLYLEGAREAGLDCAVVSASANTEAILDRAGLGVLVVERIDGNTIRKEHLRMKPAPDTMLAACRHLGVPPERAAAFETTYEGIDAARSAGLGLVFAVDRAGRAAALEARGADRVVTDLAHLLDPSLV